MGLWPFISQSYSRPERRVAVPAQPFCNLCNCEITVEHVLINCSSYDEQRAQSFEHCDSLAELFEKTPARIICGFIRDISLFYDI